MAGKTRRGAMNVQFCECGDHAFAALTKGLSTMVSPEDAEVLRSRLWQAQVYTSGRYARVTTAGAVSLARVILGLTDKDTFADHINCNPLDNRRSNLRPANPSQSGANRRRRASRALPKGVRFHKKNNRFEANITSENKVIYLGSFYTAEEAGAAYRSAALTYHREFARVE